MSEFQLPSGFIEYEPDEQLKFNYILKIIREWYEQAGFKPIETSSIGYSEVILAKAGQEMDKEIYRFQKGKRDLSLRFDLTVPLARYIAQHHRDLVFPTKLYQIGKSWRAEKPQKGRYRELYQADIDILGNDTRLAEAEMLSVTQNIIDVLELPAITFRISNRKILAGLLSDYHIQDSSAVLRHIDKISKQPYEVWLQNLKNIGLTEEQKEAILSVLSKTPVKEATGINQDVIASLKDNICNQAGSLFAQGVQELEELMRYLDLFQIQNYSIDTSIVRGQDYYTGTVFESTLTGLEAYGSICSGGRYDNLLSHYIDTPITGFGASIGVSRLFGILKEEPWFQAKNFGEPIRGIFSLNQDSLRQAVKISLSLRGKPWSDGKPLQLDLYPEVITFKKALQYANRQGYAQALFVGLDEVSSGQVLVKTMSNGRQDILAVDDPDLKNKLDHLISRDISSLKP